MRMVAAGAFHSLAVAADGGVWAWGRGCEGQLGNGGRANECGPVRMTARVVEQVRRGEGGGGCWGGGGAGQRATKRVREH